MVLGFSLKTQETLQRIQRGPHARIPCLCDRGGRVCVCVCDYVYQLKLCAARYRGATRLVHPRFLFSLARIACAARSPRAALVVASSLLALGPVAWGVSLTAAKK